MTASRKQFDDILTALSITHDAMKGQWFSLPAMKINGRIFAALWLNGDMVFKLRDPQRSAALALEGSTLFQPLPDRAAMREWVQVTPAHADQWTVLAEAALTYVQAAAEAARRKKPKA
ncbi:MAG: hypothetical protein DYG88_07635 [Chloroflexi bacterium CFX4]|nr:hypothetical protein [Chloroflexi bacterium CFX4]MDL1921197.1 hypothetical protein [Chloroflexi bacterium CFX3]